MAKKYPKTGLQAWKNKYYPTPATKVPKRRALIHSINKWQGLQPEVLKKYRLKSYDRLIGTPKAIETIEVVHKGGDKYGVYAILDVHPDLQRQVIAIDDESCALCMHYMSADTDCEGCPLSEARGGVRCDRCMDGIEEMSPYEALTAYNNPRPMLAWLLLAQNKRKK